MKKIITILLIFIQVSIYSQVGLLVEAGYIDGKYAVDRGGELLIFTFNKPAFFTDIHFSYQWKFVRFEQEFNNTGRFDSNSHSISPIDIEFKSNLIFEISKRIEFGLSHYCLHPVINTRYSIESYRRWSGNKIFLRLNLIE
jgi:hypothetical protein